ncbi:MAG: methionyl-tRNA formyltransferase, partial [Candidatus Rokuibacteriota bacterium]
VLDIPVLGCINVHASLLPCWRGAAPIAAAILAGDTETGVTLMRMTAGLDTGPILHQIRCPIADDDTAGDLHDRLADLGKQALAEALPAVLAGHIDERLQEEPLATYAPKNERAQARLDWRRPAVELARRVRAFNPRPVAFGEVAGNELRVFEAVAVHTPTERPPGSVRASGEGLDVATSVGVLRLLRVQAPGRRPLSAAEFLRGHPEIARA